MTKFALPAAALAAPLAAFALAGCVVGPNYAGAPAAAPHASAGGAFARADDLATAQPAGRWWLAMNDAGLNRLEDAALAGNLDLEVYRTRLDQSRASLRNSRAQRLPTISASAAYIRTTGGNSLLTGAGAAQSAAAGAGGSTVVTDTGGSGFEFLNVGGVATWEPDFFGGKTRAVEGARAREEAARYDLETAKVSVSAEVASAYVMLRDLQTRLALQKEDAEVEAKVVADTQLRVKGGTVSELDLERLNDQLQSTRAEFAPLQAQIAEQLNRLAVLTGQEPGQLDSQLTAATAAPPLPPASVTVGDPAGLLRRRPDIRAAERRIQAANASIGQHTADLFPKVNVFGNLGFGASTTSSLFSGDSFSTAAAPFVQWSIFDFGRVRSQIDLAKGQTAEAVAQYKSTVLSALQDAETSVARYARQRDRVAGLMRVQASADRVATLTGIRVRGGTASVIDQLDAERQRVATRQGVASAQAQLTLYYVALQKSLGLGWETPAAS